MKKVVKNGVLVVVSLVSVWAVSSASANELKKAPLKKSICASASWICNVIPNSNGTGRELPEKPKRK